MSREGAGALTQRGGTPQGFIEMRAPRGSSRRTRPSDVSEMGGEIIGIICNGTLELFQHAVDVHHCEPLVCRQVERAW